MHQQAEEDALPLHGMEPGRSDRVTGATCSEEDIGPWESCPAIQTGLEISSRFAVLHTWRHSHLVAPVWDGAGKRYANCCQASELERVQNSPEVVCT